MWVFFFDVASLALKCQNFINIFVKDAPHCEAPLAQMLLSSCKFYQILKNSTSNIQLEEITNNNVQNTKGVVNYLGIKAGLLMKVEKS